MKILMTADAVGGVWAYSLELALAARDVEIVLATMGPRPTAAQRVEAREARNIRLIESDYALEWMPDPWEDVARAGEWLLELESREQPSIIHLNGYSHGALPWSAPAIIVAHSCCCTWWRSVKREPPPQSMTRYRGAVRAGLDGASLVIAPTRAMLRALEEEHGAISNTRVIQNCRQPSLFRPLPKKQFVLTVGRLWDEAKNVKAVERVAPRIQWPVFIAGPTSAPGGTTEYASTARYLGSLSTSEIAEWFSRASIYALPARYEPFGLSALEAALAGCALVLGDIPTLREVWDGAAMFVDPEDDDALATALNALISDDTLRARVAAACQHRARRFTPARMAAAYMSAVDAARQIKATATGRMLACAS